MVIKLVKPSHYAGWFGLLWLAILALTPKPFGQTNEVVFCATAPYLTWLCSPDMRVTGYIVYVASLSSSLTNILRAGNTNLVDLVPVGIVNVTNAVWVTAHDSMGNESSPSTVLYFYLARPALGGASGFGFVVK